MTAQRLTRAEDSSSWLATLRGAVRPEFQAELIRIDVDNPVFARGRCLVEGCDRGGWTRQLCSSHYNRWRREGKPAMASYTAAAGPITARAGSERVDAYDLRRLDVLRRLEVAHSIQCRHDDRTVRIGPDTIRQLVALLIDSDTASVLDWPAEEWVRLAIATGRADPGSRTVGLLRYAHARLGDLAGGVDVASEHARDTWRAHVLGHHPLKGPRRIHFGPIAQPWLRDPAKRYARFRLATGKAFASVEIDVRAVRYFSRFLTEHHPDVTVAGLVCRATIEHYLSWVTSLPLTGHTTNTMLVCLRGFLETCRRYDWMPGLPATSGIYLDELPRRPRPLPRFIPEFVMAQIDLPANLALLSAATRHLLILLIETGLRINDACPLPFNPIITDSVGWPCLKYYNHKMMLEQLVPLSERAAETIRAQQADVTQRWPGTATRLFPSSRSNPDGVRPYSAATFRTRLARWQDAIGLHDEAGKAVRVTAHQFRHTLGTRMINNGVPQHVVQRLLGHASPQMTARYATLHDSTVRAAFDDFQTRRVDIGGHHISFDPDGPTADAEWIKHNLARIQASLPNGYCGRPPQQDCPHPNACLTCPDFQTTPEFLPIHRRQRDDTLVLIDTAEQAGRTRQAANHQQVLDNLNAVIDGLHRIQQEPTA